ncbi:MAG: DUF4239 domain-containing protein [Deltaproteobacteria bacterium]|nr:DUF4239 domain-containing protein [Deltaproteobacteria bacterium]
MRKTGPPAEERERWTMSPLAISAIVFACIFGGALLGMVLRPVLPERHKSAETKSLMNLGMGLIATMAAVVLGLLIAAAQSSYGAQLSELQQLSANVVFLDRILGRYGPEAKNVRELLRQAVVRVLAQTWPGEGAQPGQLDVRGVRPETLYDQIQDLAPQTDVQRSLQTQALGLAVTLGQTRWLMFEQKGSSIPMPFLVVLVFWLALIFLRFGLSAPPNATVVVTLLVCALSLAGALFLILELDQPFAGLIQIPSTPLRAALGRLD